MNSRLIYINNQYGHQTKPTGRTNYYQLYQKNSDFAAVQFLSECCIKLEVKPSTFAYAVSILHRVNRNLVKSDYDKFSLATGALILASKVNEDPVRLKDTINVSQVTLDDESLKELGNDSWILSIRDSIVQSELFIMRVLHFDPSIKLPHPYLFSYIKTLESWLDDKIITQTPIAKCAVSLLQDFYFNPAVIEFKPDHVAVSCIALTFQIYGLKIPGMEDADIWYKAFCPDLTLDNLWKIIDAVLKVYEIENEVYR